MVSEIAFGCLARGAFKLETARLHRAKDSGWKHSRNRHAAILRPPRKAVQKRLLAKVLPAARVGSFAEQ